MGQPRARARVLIMTLLKGWSKSSVSDLTFFTSCFVLQLDTHFGQKAARAASPFDLSLGKNLVCFVQFLPFCGLLIGIFDANASQIKWLSAGQAW